jgi:hypothetical protein
VEHVSHNATATSSSAGIAAIGDGLVGNPDKLPCGHKAP